MSVARKKKGPCVDERVIQGNLLANHTMREELIIELISESIALQPGLVKVVVEQRGMDGYVKRWLLPIQWTSNEASEIVARLRNVLWELDPDGIPYQREKIDQICEEIADRGSRYRNQNVTYCTACYPDIFETLDSV